MGSPASPVVANIYMDYFENLTSPTAPHPPRVWKRYVDDTFCILKKGTIQESLDHLNSICPSIQFTVEVEDDGTLPLNFLDAKLH